jgi:hypothetical protein
MQRLKVLVALLLATPAFASAHRACAATFITFDDIPSRRQNDDFPVYFHKGFDFSGNLFWIDVEGSYEQDWAFGAHSGEFALLNVALSQGSIRRMTRDDFTFDGLWAKKWRTAPESGGEDSLFGHLTGRRDGEVVWTIDTGLHGSYKYFEPQPGLIDELILGFGSAFLVDDILLNAQTVETPVAGDFDWDYVVDNADLAFWREKYSQTSEADADLDGDSDGNDFLIWQRNYGATSLPPTAVGVPEPVACNLAVIAVFMSFAVAGRLRPLVDGRH